MKKLLVVVDYQIDFVNGALGFDGADSIYPAIIEQINLFNKEKQTVVFTKDTHFDNYLETEEGKHLPIKHCIKATKGHELFGSLEEMSKGHLVFEKETFGSKELFSYLLENKFDEITLVGLVSNICVISNAVIAKAALPNAHIRVIKNATGSYDLPMQEKGFAIMQNLHVELV